MSDAPANTIRSRRVVLPEGERPASITMRDGIIERIGPYEREGEDLGDLVVLPGLIDPHVHVNEPGRTEWEGFETATRAAAAGGITLIADMPLNSSPVTTTVDALETKREAAAGKLTIDVAFHGGLVPGNADEMSDLVAAGAAGIKAFLCHSGLDDFPNATRDDLLAAMKSLGPLGVPLLAHAELVREVPGVPAMNNPRSFADFVVSRPRAFEQDAVRLLIELCRLTRCAVHIVHLADAQCLPMLREARREGLPVTVETCPHYLFFDPATIPDGATRYKCTPPIRGDGRELLAALMDGDIDLVASDHSPCLPSMRRTDGRFDLAWGGISSLQLGASIIRTLDPRITPSHLARWMSSAPAKLLGVSHERGGIAIGKRADLAVMDWDRKWTVDAAKLHHRHAVTPYDGCRLTGLVRRTYLAGRRVHDAADGFAMPRTGTTVTRGKTAHAPRISLRRLNAMASGAATDTMKRCCGAQVWCKRMAAARPFEAVESLHRASEANFDSMSESDWLEVFTAHPKIGDVDSLRMKFAGNKEWSGGEQSGVSGADEAILQALAAGNADYESRFGFIFIVCATGKSAGQMLELLRARLGNSRDVELKIAAGEQRKITRLRIDKLFA